MSSWSINQKSGVAVPVDVFVSTMREQHERLLQTFGAFDEARWKQPTRCGDWDAHTVFRHVADNIEMHTASFTGVLPDFAANTGDFDPRSTPDAWLAASASDSVAQSLDRFERASTQMQEVTGEAFRSGNDRRNAGPYGSAHWSVVSVHVLWDAWIHERDVLLVDDANPLPPTVSGSVDEQRLLTMYGALMTMVPRAMIGQPLTATITLDHVDADPLHLELASKAQAVSSTQLANLDQPDVRGDLVNFADALAGRGQALADVLDGRAEIIEAMALLGQLI